MAFRLSLLPLLCLLLVLILSPSHTTPSTALVIAAADDDVSVEDANDDITVGADEDEDDEEDDEEDDLDDDDDAEPDPPSDPNKPAVIDPPGQEKASGYEVPDFSAALFFDGFQDGLAKWTHTQDAQYSGKFVVGQGANPTFKGDRALIIPEKAKRYGISAKVSGFEDLSATSLVLQYEVKLDEGMTCGGAYMKLPTTGFDPLSFDGSTTYSVMFGPDKCGSTDKVHFIFQSKNPVTGEMKEHHLEKPPSVANSYDKKTHVYTLAVKSDGTFQVLIDNDLKKEGSLADSFDPPVQPPKEIDDPDDKKPDDWVDEAKIADPDATKPDDWDEDAPKEIPNEDAEKPEGWLDDEPEKIPDSEAEKPKDWDDDEDGEWEAPLVPNPKCADVGCGEWKRPMKTNPDYKGKWKAPLIDNPKYIGDWKPRKIANKEYYEVPDPKLLPVHGLGFEIWTMDQGVLFDNVWLGTDLDAAKKFANETFSVKQKEEIARLEKENAEREKKEASKSVREGKLGVVMDRVEDAISRLEDMLEPLESWLVKVGAEPYLEKLIDAGVGKPMLAVVSVPLVIVCLILIILGGRGKSSEAPEEAPEESVAAKKKTDEPSPDDPKDTSEERAPDDEVKDISDSQATDSTAPEKSVRRRRTATAE